MKKADGLNQRCKVIPLSARREQRDHEQLLLDLEEFIAAKTMAGEPIIVIIERNISFLARFKQFVNNLRDTIKEKQYLIAERKGIKEN